MSFFCGECSYCRRLLEVAEEGGYACEGCHGIYLRGPPEKCHKCGGKVKKAAEVLNLDREAG